MDESRTQCELNNRFMDRRLGVNHELVLKSRLGEIPYYINNLRYGSFEKSSSFYFKVTVNIYL